MSKKLDVNYMSMKYAKKLNTIVGLYFPLVLYEPEGRNAGGQKKLKPREAR